MVGGACAAATAVTWPAPAWAEPQAVGSTPAAEYDGAVADEWFDLSRSLVQRTPGYSPPVASRAFGCLAVSLYEAVVPGMPGHRSMVGLLDAASSMPHAGRNVAYHWPTVANRSLAQTCRSLIPLTQPALHDAITALEKRITAELGATVALGVFRRSVERGTAVAAAIDDWARADGGHDGYLRNFPATYVPPVGPGMWEPTLPGFQRAMQPTWGTNRCFALTSVGHCDPPPPPAYSTEPGSELFVEAAEVYEAVDTLTAEQLAIARFWSDDPRQTATPPGHSISLATQILRDEGASLELAAETYVRVGCAVADAFISSWRVKFLHNLQRPVTYIRNVIDPTWGDPSGPHPLPLITPPFPEYTSGHSVQSAAVAVVLGQLFAPRAFTDHTHDSRGLAPRHFSSFEAAAEEAAISRLYGGIHFRSGIERGLEQGRCIGLNVAALPLRR